MRQGAVTRRAGIVRAVTVTPPVVAVNAEGGIGHTLSRTSPALTRRRAGFVRLTGGGEISRLTNKH